MTKIIKKSVSFLLFCCIVFSSAASGYLYRKLGVLSYSPSEKITENFERFKKRIHPNYNSNSEESRERFQELEEAYAVLIDPDRRSQYDQHLKKTQTSEADNFYEVLGVLSNSSPERIRRAYQELRSYIHPDKNDNNKESTERSQELKKAFDTLSDPVRRIRHDASLQKSYIIPYLKRDEEAERDLRERDQESAETVKTGIHERGTAELKFGSEDNEDDLEATLWNEQIFQLAKDLEKEGGEANITEAVSYYRRLAQESHIDAAWRLARLLEDRDIKEAFYRYKQVQNLDTDGGDLARSSVFRQAQLYHIGVYKGKNEIFAPNSKKASELYEEAFRLGVSQQEIAAQYDRQQDYQMALEWQQREESNKPSQQLTKDTKGSILLMQHKWQRKPDYVQQIRGGKLTELHLAILHQDTQLRSTGKKQEAVIDMIHHIVRDNPGIDINAQDIWKRTPLHLAISRWYLQVVDLLLKLEANVNIPDKNGNTALDTAFIFWDLKKIKKEAEIGVEPNIRDEEEIQFMLSYLTEVTNLTRKNFPLVYWTDKVSAPDELMTIVFIKHGGYRHLALAILHHHLEAAEKIINKVGIENFTNKERSQLMQLAIKSGYPNLVNFLKQWSKSSSTAFGRFSQFLDICRKAFTKP